MTKLKTINTISVETPEQMDGQDFKAIPKRKDKQIILKSEMILE